MLVHLAWRRNLDGYDLAVAANRLASRGVPLWWLGASGPKHEPGDYLCDVDAGYGDRLAGFGIVAARWDEALPGDAVVIAHPRIALFAGAGSPFPAFAYYAMALARLGFDFELIDGAAIASGALARFDLLVLPAEFSVWGLDAAEGVSGADAAVRDFLAGSGAALGSGGGAFYLSSGRPGWSNVALARPVYTHEYLRTGVGIVSLRFGADSIAFGCPPTLEMPYYHGPVFAELDRAVSAAATFDRLMMPGHLFVANPLDEAFFAREMAGHTAIIRAETRRGRALLFSANPEMGDLVRKYVALDEYVVRYLPIRGEAAMADTLRHYQPLNSPTWRVILNAVHSLMLRFAPPGAMPATAVPVQPPEPAMRLAAALDAALRRLKLDGDAPLCGLVEVVRDDLLARIVALGERLAVVETAFSALDPPAPGIRYLWAGCEAARRCGRERRAAGGTPRRARDGAGPRRSVVPARRGRAAFREGHMTNRAQGPEPIVYDPVTRRLHWLNAILALITILLAWCISGAPRHSDERSLLVMLHGSCGITILAVMLFWTGWRLRHRSPPLRPVLTAVEVLLARGTQWAIFLLFIAMPVSGYVSLTAAGQRLSLFGLVPLPPLVPESGRLSQAAIALHLLGEFLIYGLVALHVSAALMHGFIRRDGILERMLPRRS